MILILAPYVSYLLLGLAVTVACAGWAGWVAADKYHNLSRDDRREVILGLVIIALICAPLAPIAAYWSKPIPTPQP